MWEVPQAPQLRRGIQAWLQLSKEVTTQVMEFLLDISQFNDVMCTVNAVHFYNLKLNIHLNFTLYIYAGATDIKIPNDFSTKDIH